MELVTLIEQLSDPAAYPGSVRAVDVRHTHISVVFLTEQDVYKIKKPVNLGFLDFSTLEKRRHYCEEEVRLNRRLAPAVYRGVVPLTRMGGRIQVAGSGEVVEWAVHMERLPEQATLLHRLQGNLISSDLVVSLARKLAQFHAHADSSAAIATHGRFEMVAHNARENFAQVRPHVGTSLSQAVFDRLQARTEAALIQLRPLCEARAARGVPRDTHGDLHLDHVYLFPERQPPDDLVIIDCIEFNERFRYADPMADMAFLVMDLKFHGRGDLARDFAAAYFEASGDTEGRALLPFYTAYRAAIRGKVEGMKATEPEVPPAERAASLTRAKAHWLLALGELEEPRHRPSLVLVAGLPGTGKSTLARSLAEAAGFTVVRSDVVRKELAGATSPDTAAAFGEGIYTLAWTTRTYAECLRRVEQALFEGQRVLVDANFAKEQFRREFLAAAARLGVPCLFLHCQADPDIVCERLARRRGDASDADWAVYQQAAAAWEPPSPATRACCQPIDTGRHAGQALAEAQAILRSFDIF